ncbi:MAG: hypothetical protein E7233_05405 [Lachnospiraceae bacterium]|nr:hypothetical protein [Lachnospiraceae bacterium]
MKIFILFAALTLVFSQAGAVFASDDERESLEEYLEELKVQIESVNQNLDDIYNSINDVNTSISDNTALIDELTVSLDEQKAAMMKRIQYMYEAGSNMDILLALLTSDSISDSLNKAAYISQMVSYDREMLENYVNTINAINETTAALETEREELIALKENFENAKYDSALAMEQATVRLAEYDIEASRVQEVIEEYMGVEEVIEIPDLSEYDTGEETSGNTEGNGDDNGDVSVTEPEREPETEEETTTAPPSGDDGGDNGGDDGGDNGGDGGGDSGGEDSGDDGGSGYYVPISTYNYSEEEIYDMARVTYLEDGCVYPEGSYRSVYLCACVILNRANNWYGGSISAAIYASGQYATAYKYTSWGGGPLVINDITWQAVNDALSNCDPNPYYQCNGQHLAGAGLTEYYRDPVTDEVFYYPY